MVAKSVARRELKVPITGPYTLADWTLNEYYVRKALQSATSVKEAKRRARREFVFDLVDNVLGPELRDLMNAGATRIRVDEPAVATHPSRKEMGAVRRGFQQADRGHPVQVQPPQLLQRLRRPDCGLGTRMDLRLVFEKLRNMVKSAKLARAFRRLSQRPLS